MDVKRAFTYFFLDQESLIKLANFLKIVIIPTGLYLFFYILKIRSTLISDTALNMISSISIFYLLIALGYLIKTAHNEISNKFPVLPIWEGNYARYFMYGVCTLLACLAYFSLPRLISFYYFKNSGLDAISITFSIIITLIIPFTIMSYAQELEIFDAFRIKRVLIYGFKHIKSYFKLFVQILILVFLGVIILPKLSLSIINLFILPSLNSIPLAKSFALFDLAIPAVVVKIFLFLLLLLISFLVTTIIMFILSCLLLAYFNLFAQLYKQAKTDKSESGYF